MATRLIGRHDELGSIEAFLGQVEHDPVALVVSGEPGIGETILCEAMFFRCLLRRGPVVLAAERRANKQIASALFMSVHTVEAHLTRVYRKLGIHSRGELASRLARQADAESKQPEVAAKQ